MIFAAQNPPHIWSLITFYFYILFMENSAPSTELVKLGEIGGNWELGDMGACAKLKLTKI